jgi:RNA-directed DNA polymerase
MDFVGYSKKFRTKARKAGYSDDQIVSCLDYAKQLFAKNIPVIYNTDHFSVLVGYNKVYIKRAVSYPKAFYRTFYIRKKNGNKRRLSEPLPSLKEIQNWILNSVLYKNKVHSYAKAYVPGFTIKDNIRYHVGKPEVLSLDIENFFDMISDKLVEPIFKDMGYSQLVSSLLTKLVTLDGRLAQGSPTSPYLSNLVMRKFDSVFEAYSKKHKIMFTRYADDITFSGKELNKEKIVSDVSIELRKIGLRLNSEKTKLMNSRNRQVITGVVVNVKAQMLRKDRKLIRQEVYYIRKYGLVAHMKRKNLIKANYLSHLLGKINYSIFLNPKDTEMISYKTYLVGLIG